MLQYVLEVWIALEHLYVCAFVYVCVYMGWVCVNIILVKKKGTAQASIYSTLLISGEALDVSIHIRLDVAMQRQSIHKLRLPCSL